MVFFGGFFFTFWVWAWAFCGGGCFASYHGALVLSSPSFLCMGRRELHSFGGFVDPKSACFILYVSGLSCIFSCIISFPSHLLHLHLLSNPLFFLSFLSFFPSLMNILASFASFVTNNILLLISPPPLFVDHLSFLLSVLVIGFIFYWMGFFFPL